MAKLSDLKALLAAAQAKEARRPVRAPKAVPAASALGGCQLAAPPIGPDPAPRAPATRRNVAATKHADGDVDLAQAFADVDRLPPANRPPSRARARRRSRTTRSPTSATCSRRRSTATTRRRSRGTPARSSSTSRRSCAAASARDLAGKLRRGHWSVQAELDLHGLTTDEAHDALSDFIVERARRGATAACASSTARD